MSLLSYEYSLLALAMHALGTYVYSQDLTDPNARMSILLEGRMNDAQCVAEVNETCERSAWFNSISQYGMGPDSDINGRAYRPSWVERRVTTVSPLLYPSTCPVG